MRYIILLIINILVLALLFTSCGGAKQGDSANKESQTELQFVLPEIPELIQEPEYRLDYLVHHYWDNFHFNDTAYIHLPEVTEQALVDYLDLLVKVPAKTANACIVQLIKKAAVNSKMLTYFNETLEDYCINPNSPMRNEELYLPVAEYLANNQNIDIAMRSRAEFDAKKIKLNRKGTVANDFVYTLASGKQSRMHQLNKEYTLLLFYDPDCTSCQEQLDYLRNSPMFTGKEFLEHVSVLAFYFGEEHELWADYQDNIPEGWINAYDRNGDVISNMLYNIEAAPSLYLLDREKHVLLKDASIKEIENYFTKQ